VYGLPPRRGQIIELIGHDHHERDRVRWDEKHESILYPADGVVIIPRRRRRTSHASVENRWRRPKPSAAARSSAVRDSTAKAARSSAYT
jgi:hypothetical protein